ncbi:hypothetical protein H5P28_18030 [Ruficoccus amylovorans]|uniref:Uncharacterized protein n=1 Tax=Ruficoccus amylovorans TaxID=1804625 RepID=A0A842HM45_9BACT|nr:hypothetical protein [Ruficoccus amylovorans]MBC2596171.1 hypothetical protein [Ruficoccus amylovorans]
MINKNASKEGFALIIALTLMAFVLLLLMSLATLTRVDIATSEVSRATLEAKKNAELGLLTALGELQRLAGPDQRATANVALIDEDATNTRYWTGVWDSSSWDPQNPGQRVFLGWLVSGNPAAMANENAYDNLPASNMTIVGKDSARVENQVAVPLVEVDSGSGLSNGKYAYWISDESLKAKVNIDDPYRRESQSDTATEKARVFLPQTNALDMDTRLGGVTVWKSENWGSWDRVYNLETLPLLDSDFAAIADLHGSGASRQDYYDETFHHYTAEGYGLLVDTQHGGLRKNLTAAFQDDTVFSNTLEDERIIEPDDIDEAWRNGVDFTVPRWDILRDYALMPERETELQAQAPEFTERFGGFFADEEPRENDIAPLMTRFGLYYRATASENAGSGTIASTYNLTLVIYPRVTLWNPYNVPLTLSDGYEFQVYLKPFFNFTKNGASFFSGTLRDISDAGRDYFTFRLDGSALEPEDRVIQPGESRTFGMKDLVPADNLSKGGKGQIFVTLDPYLNDNAGIEYVAADATENLQEGDWIGLNWNTHSSYSKGNTTKSASVQFSKRNSSGTYLIQQVSGFGLDKPDGNGYSEDVPIALDTDGDGDIDEGLVIGALDMGGYDIRLKHAGEEDDQGVPVVAAFNPRAYYHGILSADYADEEPPNWAVDATDTEPLYQDFESTPNGNLLKGRWGTSIEAAGQSNVILFDLPRAFPQSLAEFRNANLSYRANLPALALGNSWANPHLSVAYAAGISGGETQMDLSWLLNTALFDRYFLSSLPDDTTEDTVMSLPNSRLNINGGSAALTDIDSYDNAAQYLTIDGAFNVNTTSTKAWAALLGSLTDSNVQVYNLDSGTVASPDMSRAVFRFTRPLTGTNEAEWYQGHWELTEQQVRELADAIVAQVRARGPFMNLADFVNRRLVTGALGKVGALQAAIDATTINDTFESDYGLEDANLLPGTSTFADGEIKQGAGITGDLTQADILSAIGPVITTRGDTFKVVVYGEGPGSVVGQSGAGIYLQAIVQRTAEYVDASNAPTVEPDDTALTQENKDFGRRFKIVSLEWFHENPL